MIVIPSIGVRAGEVVRGPRNQMLPADPTGCAMEVAARGARRIQLVNRDAARGIDDPRSRRAVRGALNALRDGGVTVDISAGVRSRAGAEFWIESGAATAMLDTIAVYRPDIAGEICRDFPGQIMLGLEVHGALTLSEGWIRDAGPATIHLRRWSPWPAAGVVRSAPDGDHLNGELAGQLRDCVQAYTGSLLVSGQSAALADLVQAATAGAAAVVAGIADNAEYEIGDAIRLFPGDGLKRH